MLYTLILFTFWNYSSILIPTNASDETYIVYYDKEHFLIEGTVIPDSLKESSYDRLPLSYKDKVRQPVWNLSKNSAGITVSFHSNSSEIHLKWTLLNDFYMNHMASTGIKGVDLYVRQEGNWRYVNTGRPSSSTNEVRLVQNLSLDWREYKLFLPLYDGVTNLEIGIDANSSIKKAIPSDQKPIVFYGTSITQGGCASRPGMAHTNIISRKLDREVINFGFSGNGRMEEPILELISEIDAQFFVIECLQNMDTSSVKKRALEAVKTIRKKHPNTPILFGDNMLYEIGFMDKTIEAELIRENAILLEECQKMEEKGFQNVYYISNANALGEDHEGTVDGVHLTDLGFLRYANHLISNFKSFGILED
jgi:hypothetical protein